MLQLNYLRTMNNQGNKIENKILKYSDLMYNSGPVRAYDYISEKYTNIHKQIYDRALEKLITNELVGEGKLCETFDELKTKYCFIELKKDEYYKPSKVVVKQTVYPFEAYTYDLSEYWDNYQYKEEFKELKDYWIDEDSVRDAELIYIDYIKGKGKFKSRYTGKEFWADFKFINQDTKISKDDLSLENTFSYKIQNKIYGR